MTGPSPTSPRTPPPGAPPAQWPANHGYPVGAGHGYPISAGHGYPPGSPYPPVANRAPVDGLAIAALVFGIIGGVLFAVGFGIGAIRRIRRGGGRGMALAVAGLSLAGVWLLVLAILVAFNIGRRPTRNDAGAISHRGQLAPLDMHVGDCLELPRELPATAMKKITVMPCGDLHNGQVFARANVDPGPYPGTTMLRADSLAKCKSLAATYLGKPSLLHVVAFFAASEEAWNLGDTSQTCVLVDRQSEITGDIRAHA